MGQQAPGPSPATGTSSSGEEEAEEEGGGETGAGGGDGFDAVLNVVMMALGGGDTDGEMMTNIITGALLLKTLADSLAATRTFRAETSGSTAMRL